MEFRVLAVGDVVGDPGLEAVLFTIDTDTGRCLRAERVDEWD